MHFLFISKWKSLRTCNRHFCIICFTRVEKVPGFTALFGRNISSVQTTRRQSDPAIFYISSRARLRWWCTAAPLASFAIKAESGLWPQIKSEIVRCCSFQFSVLSSSHSRRFSTTFLFFPLLFLVVPFHHYALDASSFRFLLLVSLFGKWWNVSPF